jgi:hypothetical protein
MSLLLVLNAVVSSFAMLTLVTKTVFFGRLSVRHIHFSPIK